MTMFLIVIYLWFQCEATEHVVWGDGAQSCFNTNRIHRPGALCSSKALHVLFYMFLMSAQG